ncbi:hypothetical protein BXO88_15990 [Oribacterium sp. C9]|uniref:hypothetical protein n=1 Tax=Oribacterium sp. C9 TaxID=1943579 RepID=UPI00098EAE6D|nr:hypothetical protein [Oribacterium sp. C9]OON84705.1 hypothetical protein BXO88_15990 [Oribacterium sp. C9]
MDIKNFDFSKLDPKIREKAEKCESMEELMDLAKTCGIELTDAQLDQLSGGGILDNGCYDCPEVAAESYG